MRLLETIRTLRAEVEEAAYAAQLWETPASLRDEFGFV